MNRALSSEPEVTRDEVETLFAAELYMTPPDEPERKRIDWINVAAWGGAGILCLVFWAFVAWGILGRVL